jgi:predicted nucleic acid-binding Zn ribbon protein
MIQASACPNCGSPVAAGQYFCQVCGMPLGAGCPRCGAMVAPGVRFCTNCGAAIATQKPKRRSFMPLLVVAVLVFAVGIGGIVYWQLGAIKGSAGKGPVISNVVAKQTTLTTATIIWNTDVPASSQIEYGRSSSYGFLAPSDPKNDPTLGMSAGTTDHSILLSNLASNTTYHFRVRSKDTDGNETVSTGDRTFKTKPSDENRYNPLD